MSRVKFSLPAKEPGMNNKQYRSALVGKFRSDNDALADTMRVLFVMHGKMSKASAGPIDIAPELFKVTGATFPQYLIDRRTIKSLHSRALELMGKQGQYVQALSTRKQPGRGGEAFNVSLIVKDDLHNFLLDAANGGALPRDLSFLNPASDDYRITSRGILSTLMDIYRLAANGGAGLQPVGEGKSILTGDERIVNLLAGIFQQIGAEQQAAIQAAGSQVGMRKNPAKFNIPKKDGTPRKQKATDLWRIDTPREFQQNALRSSVVAKGTYSTKNMDQAATDPSPDVQAAYGRLQARPRLEGDERKAYTTAFREYAQRAEAQMKASGSNQAQLPSQDAAFAAVANSTPAGQVRLRRDDAAVTLKNVYAQIKAQRPGAAAGVMSPAKFIEQRS